MVFPDAPTWTVETLPNGWSIDFSPAALFDLSTIFDLIPRDRIEAVRQTQDGALVIESTCSCALAIETVGQRVVAVDIRDAPQPSGAPAAAPPRTDLLPLGLTIRSTTEVMASPLPPWSDAVRAQPPTGAPRAVDAAAPGPGIEAAALPPSAAQVDLSSTPVPGETPGADSALANRLAGLSDALRRDLAQAAEAGLIDLVDPMAPPPTDGSSPTPNAAGEEARNVDLRTGNELYSVLLGAEEVPTIECPSPTIIGFLRQESPQRQVAALGDLRENLVDARGTVSPDGALSLLEGYLWLGFGAEARTLVPQLNASDATKALLTSLSEIMDDRHDSAAEIWSGFETCESPIALWALLGHDAVSGTDMMATDSIQAAFFALPEHLRLHLGDEVAARLRGAGQRDAAAAIENNVAALRAPVPRSYSEGAPERPIAAEDIAPTVQPSALSIDISGLLNRFDEAVSLGTPLSETDLALADAFADEFTGTEDGARLDDALALGRLQEGDVAGALSHFRAGAPDGRLPPSGPKRFALTQSIISQSDAGLLSVALHPDGALLFDLLSVADALSVAGRLLDLGFPDAALTVLSQQDQENNEGLRRARARAILATGDARQALALLAGAQTIESKAVRAAAYEQLGEYAMAAALYQEAGSADKAAHAAWISADPELVDAYGTGAQRALISGLEKREGSSNGRNGRESPVAPLQSPRATELRTGPGVIAPAAPALAEGSRTPSDRRNANGALSPEDPITATNVGGDPLLPERWTIDEARGLLDQGAQIRDAVLALEGLSEEGS